MMPKTTPKTWDVNTLNDLRSIGYLKSNSLEDILSGIDARITFIGQILASNPADAIVNIGNIEITLDDGRKMHLAPISGILQSFTGGTINTQTGAKTGNINTFTLPTASGASEYVKMGLAIDSTGYINVSFNTVSGSTGGSGEVPYSGIPLGFVNLESSGAGTAWKGDGAATNVVENNDIVQFDGAGTGGGDSGSGGAIEPAAGFRELIYDTFSELLGSSDGLVEDTNGSRGGVSNNFIELLLDKGKTFTTTGTACTISGAPSFTIAADDIIYDNTSGEWRRIASIASQTSVTLDAAFTVDLSTSAGMVSQAVFTKDFINLGDASEKTRIRDFWPSEDVTKIHVDYDDTLIEDDETPDYIDEARIVVSASNEGLRTDTSTYPTSDEFTAHYTRVQAPNDLPDYDLSVNTNQERLFLAFFPNPSNSSVTARANVIRYECSLIEDAGYNKGGILASAFCYTDGSETEINCNAPFVSGGVTHIKLGFSYDPNVGEVSGSELTTGEIEVIEDGESIPKYVSGVTVGKYWKPTSSSEIELWADRSGYKEAVEVKKRQGVNTINNDGLQLESSVVAKTGDYTVLDSEAVGNRVFTNEGAVGKVVFDLPSAVAGRKITFVCAEDQQMQIDVVGDDKIFLQNDIELDSVINSNKGKSLIMHCINSTEWICINADSWLNAAGRGVFGGGNGPVNIMDYIEISALSNAVDFGDLSATRFGAGGCANSTRVLFGGGSTGTVSNVIDYITIAIPGNATDFGDLTAARQAAGSCSNSIRGLFGGGYTGSLSNIIDYIAIATEANAVDFGDLTVIRQDVSGLASSTRGCFGGGADLGAGRYNTIDYVTIASTGNASDFGDLTGSSRRGVGALSSSTRGIFGGGDTTIAVNVIDYITINSIGNATDFGDLSVARYLCAGCSNPTRGVIGGGTTGTVSNIIDYVTIATTGNATDFGDLTAARSNLVAFSDAHGGL